MKKAAWEKLSARMDKDLELAEEICENAQYCCDESCPLYVPGKDRECARHTLRFVRNVLKAYEKRKTIRDNFIHKCGEPL